MARRHTHRVLQLALVGLKLGADRVGAAALARGRDRRLELGLEAGLSLRLFDGMELGIQRVPRKRGKKVETMGLQSVVP